MLIDLARTSRPTLADPSEVLVDVTVGETRCVVWCVAAATETGTNLSPREAEIARMVALGYTNKEIARVLDISAWTVSAHLRRVFAKLEVTTRAAMVARLLEQPAEAPKSLLTAS
ncbi:response regulator transcription factor [Jidongwangia harbinensis]|uniref:response regulator transcription factor n=1 Tax=Jidongwangia harbinensis TaxID=2878561 RepID=UPI001CD9FED1|nr:helix-turn-helix transcriptional regulator [Jidongwangia harbinensis]MCA2213912.1 helix-turn-helix transcriptional regulator [Jidongwangia harbinensis]